MSQKVVLIGYDGNPLLGLALMKLQLNTTSVTLNDDRMIEVDGDVYIEVELSLPQCLKEPAEIRHLSRRNKSDRKRNRADRWR